MGVTFPPNVRVVCDCGNEIQAATVGFASRTTLKGACRQCIFEHGLPEPEETEDRHPRVVMPLDRLMALHRMLTAVCEVYGQGECLHEELMGKDRFGENVEPRQVGHYLSIRHLGVSPRECGGFWNKDHSTVSYSVTRIEARFKVDPVLVERVEAVRLHYGVLAGSDDRGAYVHRYTSEHTAAGVAEL